MVWIINMAVKDFYTTPTSLTLFANRLSFQYCRKSSKYKYQMVKKWMRWSELSLEYKTNKMNEKDTKKVDLKKKDKKKKRTKIRNKWAEC